MSEVKTRNYDNEFKLNAVKLYLSRGGSYSQVSKELGIPSATLVGWVHSHRKNGTKAFPGKGHLHPENAELVKLQRELARTREERDILKKALGIFSSVRQ